MQSIIIFNGGSAGDFLKASCISQSASSVKSNMQSTGAVEFSSHYFKDFCEQLYLQKVKPSDLDLSKTQVVENTHFYLDVFPSWTNSLFFIDYPDKAQQLVLSQFVKKRLEGNTINQERFLLRMAEFLPPSARKYVTQDNYQHLLGIMWKKNLTLWRENKALQPIYLCDLFDQTKFINIVATISKQDPVTESLIEQHATWTTANRELLEFFS